MAVAVARENEKNWKMKKIKRKYAAAMGKGGSKRKTTMQAKMRQKKCLSKFVLPAQAQPGEGVGGSGCGNVECR